MSDLTRLNPTPHAIAVYASQPLSPAATQHSLPSGRYCLLGPDWEPALNRSAISFLMRLCSKLLSLARFISRHFGGVPRLFCAVFFVAVNWTLFAPAAKIDPPF